MDGISPAVRALAKHDFDVYVKQWDGLFKERYAERLLTAFETMYAIENASEVFKFNEQNEQVKMTVIDVADMFNYKGFTGCSIEQLAERFRTIFDSQEDDSYYLVSWIQLAARNNEMCFDFAQISEAVMNEVNSVLQRRVARIQSVKETEVAFTESEQVNQLMVDAASADDDMVITQGAPILQDKPAEAKQVLTAEQEATLSDGFATRAQLCLPSFTGRDTNLHVPIIRDSDDSDKEVYGEQDTVDVDFEEVEYADPNAGYGKAVLPKDCINACCDILKRSGVANEKSCTLLRRNLKTCMFGQADKALYLLLCNDETCEADPNGINIFRSLLKKDGITKQIADNIHSKFDVMSVLKSAGKKAGSWCNLMEISAIKKFKLDNIFYIIAKHADNTKSFAVDVWDNSMVFDDGILTPSKDEFESKQEYEHALESEEVTCIYLFSEPVQVRTNVYIRYLFVWQRELGLFKGIIIQAAYSNATDEFYTGAYVTNKDKKGSINWSASSVVYKTIVSFKENDRTFFDNEYEATETYLQAYPGNIDGYNPIHVSKESKESFAKRVGKRAGKTARGAVDAYDSTKHIKDKSIEKLGEMKQAVKDVYDNVTSDIKDGYKDGYGGN